MPGCVGKSIKEITFGIAIELYIKGLLVEDNLMLRFAEEMLTERRLDYMIPEMKKKAKGIAKSE